VISNAGTESQKIFYDEIKNLQKQDISMPFCLIIPNSLSHVEEEALKRLKFS